MKVFRNKYKNVGYLFYRIASPVFDPIMFLKGLYGYSWFVRDLIKFKTTSNEKINLINLYPALHDKSKNTSLDAHYFYQQLWVFENVLRNKPKEHVDVGSTYQMSGYLSKITKTTFVDIRPIETNLENLKVIDGDVTKLPFDNNSIESISCLHVIEHVGLGRYGDKIDPDGWKKACKELQRVLARNGKLYLSVPIGKPRVCFNAHRVFSPRDVINAFNKLQLLDFNAVDDSGSYLESVKPSDYTNANYSLGMFLFTKLKL